MRSNRATVFSIVLHLLKRFRSPQILVLHSNTGSVTLLSGSLREGGGDAETIDCRNSGDDVVSSLDSIAPGDEVRKMDERRCHYLIL